MSYDIFKSVANGYAELLSNKSWLNDDIAVLLVRHELGEGNISRTSMTYEDLSTCVEKSIPIVDPSVYVNANNEVVFTHERVIFTYSETLVGRYIFYVLGDYENLNNDDKVIGYVDLTGVEDAVSVQAEFSAIPQSDHLFDVKPTIEV